MTLEETLKKLNKGKADQDQVKKVSEIDTLNFDYCSIKSAYLSHIMDYNVVPMGAMTLLTGWEGSGKSSIALLIAKGSGRKPIPNDLLNRINDNFRRL